MAGFSFGGTSVSVATTTPGASFTFGANKPVATNSPGFSLGSNVQSSPFGTVGPGGFGSLASSTPVTSTSTFGGLSFGNTTSTAPAGTTGGFGLTSLPTAPTSLAGMSMTPSLTPMPTTTGLSFGLPTTGTTTPIQTSSTFGLGNFGTTAPISSGLPTFSSFNQSGGLITGTSAPSGYLGLQTSTVSKPPLLGTAPLALPTAVTAVSTPTFVGLGGIDVSQNKIGQTGSATAQIDNKAAKETQLPNEILQTVQEFESFMKQQKLMSSEIGRGSVKPLHKVQEETEALKQALASIDNALNRNAALVEKLKSEGAKELQNAEMAQRTHETPAGLQLENSTPLEYFTGLVAGFERDMQTLRQEIENAERHLQNQMQPVALTPQELTVSLKRLHESFIGLAGHLQEVHKTVDEQWEQYIALRRRLHRHLPPPSTLAASTSTDHSTDIASIESVAARPGPTPFSRIGGSLSTPVATMSMATAGRSPFGSIVPLDPIPNLKETKL